MPEIYIEMDQVTVESTVIKRPARISRSDWMLYWERVKYGLDSTT